MFEQIKKIIFELKKKSKTHHVYTKPIQKILFKAKKALYTRSYQ